MEQMGKMKQVISNLNFLIPKSKNSLVLPKNRTDNSTDVSNVTLAAESLSLVTTTVATSESTIIDGNSTESTSEKGETSTIGTDSISENSKTTEEPTTTAGKIR
jgi:hypothetical protein